MGIEIYDMDRILKDRDVRMYFGLADFGCFCQENCHSFKKAAEIDEKHREEPFSQPNSVAKYG